MVGWLAGGREGDPESFLVLLAGVRNLPSVMSMDAIIISDNRKLQDKNSEE